MKPGLAFSAMLLATLIATGPGSAQSNDDTGAVQVITVTAKKYEFDPSPIRVKQGTKVRLNITATDHAHGFEINPVPEGADRSGDPGLVFS